uniref:Uncharacterized protein LOC114340565 n=1 Tax=Diabrotica virgifera virgifera TaxID=50390 RepID=A0A6P7GPJ8_DIAVI
MYLQVQEDWQEEDNPPEESIFIEVAEDGPGTSGIGQEVTQCKVDSKNQNQGKGNRKRTTSTTTERGESLEKFSKLAQTKTEVSELQKSCYEADLNNKENDAFQKQEEWEKKQEMLDLDLLIKQEEYEELLRQNARREELFQLERRERRLRVFILQNKRNIMNK